MGVLSAPVARAPGAQRCAPVRSLLGSPAHPAPPPPRAARGAPGESPARGGPQAAAGEESGDRQGAAQLCDLPRAARGASRAPARASSRARAGGAGGGRAAMVAGLPRSGSPRPVASAHHATRAASGARAADPRAFPLGGASSEPRAAPRRRGDEPVWAFGFKKVPRARARRWHEPLTVAGPESCPGWPGPGKVVRQSARACEMDPRPTAPSHYHGTNYGLPRTRPAAASRGS